MISGDALKRLAALQLDPVQMSEVLGIIADMQGAEDERKAKQRARTAKFRDKNDDVTLQKRDGNVFVTPDVTAGASSPVPKENAPLHPPKEITLTPTIPNTSSSARIGAEFAEWWRAYPHKVGKEAASAAFAKARKKAELETLIEGVRRYVATKPPDRDWCNPATWLNQGRWTDEPAASNPTSLFSSNRGGPREDPLITAARREIDGMHSAWRG